jgi:nucleolar complex protein 3
MGAAAKNTSSRSHHPKKQRVSAKHTAHDQPPRMAPTEKLEQGRHQHQHHPIVEHDDDLSHATSDRNTGTSLSETTKATRTVSETCDYIAELSEAILEQPDKAFISSEIPNPANPRYPKQGPSKMKQLLVLANASVVPRHNNHNTDNDDPSSHSAYTSQLATMSLLAIFRDILPSYRIKLPTTQQAAVKVSKETKVLWDYERALLQSYQEYLQILEHCWDATRTAPHPSQLGVTSILSLCELLKSAFHFNFRSNLLTVVSRHTNHPSTVVGDACCAAIAYVFAHDAQGEVALEATRLLAKFVKDRAFKIRPSVLRTFTSLPLRVHVDEAQAAKLAAAANAKKRKKDKELAEIDAELKESDAKVDKIILARCQSETLQHVTLTYFRILKHDNLQAAHVETLLPAALEGLAKFAHLINIDTVMDLLGVLKDLLKKMNALPLEAALNCILTAFQTLQGPGKEMNIDVKEYIVPLYTQLPRLVGDVNCRRHLPTVLLCLNAAFIKRREYSTIRVSAFWKQILTVSLHVPPHTAVPLIAFGRQLLQRYPVTHQMLENEQDVITSGEYTPDVEDPEHSNPLATSAWELALAKFHVHLSVVQQAQSTATLRLPNLPTESPERLYQELIRAEDELFFSFQRVRKKHPLTPPKHDGSKKRKQYRFLTPRATELFLLKANAL